VNRDLDFLTAEARKNGRRRRFMLFVAQGARLRRPSAFPFFRASAVKKVWSGDMGNTFVRRHGLHLGVEVDGHAVEGQECYGRESWVYC
jgi:hypothetical protein